MRRRLSKTIFRHSHHKEQHSKESIGDQPSIAQSAQDGTDYRADMHSQEGSASSIESPAPFVPVESSLSLAAPSRCPFHHGTVRCDPYPGYVHGRHPEICPAGCAPLAKGALDHETPVQRLLREALEYNGLYHHEMGLGAAKRDRRAAEITQQVQQTGLYTHTADELQHGARVAWRASPS